jgi:hypothetical protein
MVTLSLDVTSTAGVVSSFPLTQTRPWLIHRSASRREHMPARAMALAMRVGSPGALGAGRFVATLRALGAFALRFLDMDYLNMTGQKPL